MSASFITFKNHAGWMVRGNAVVPRPSGASHMEAVAYLVSQVETGGKFGTVQSYDGAGMSAGLLHNVAVLPSTMTQGDLWLLIAHMRDAVGSLGIVGVKMAAAGWALTAGGVLMKGGKQVTGAEIRQEFVGSPDGNGLPGYTRGKEWAEGFSLLFSDPSTFDTQIAFAILWLAKGKAATEQQAYAKFGISGDLKLVLRSQLQPEIDMAMSVYHCFSVNAPTPAADILMQALAHYGSGATAPHDFAKDLISRFGKSDFARWHDDPQDQGSRYDSTRVAVEKSGLWSLDLVHALMPRNL